MKSNQTPFDVLIEAAKNKFHMCQEPGCKHPCFDNKGSLDRHRREVHGSRTYCCPFVTCKRHIQGFPRKYNLFEHQKHCHRGYSPNTAPGGCIPSFQPRTSLCGRGSEGGISSGGDVSSPMEMPITKDVTRANAGGLLEKLEGMYALREELCNDIATVEGALHIMDMPLPKLPLRPASAPTMA